MTARPHFELADVAESWPVSARTDLHRDDWVMAFRRDLVESPAGERFGRFVLEHPGAAVILAVDAEDRVFCLRQYRHPAAHRFVELPAGLCDVAGEDALTVARRELAEEAELAAEQWTHLATAYASPGISAERYDVFLARGLSPAPRADFVPEHEEADMESGWVPFADLHAGVIEGRVTDGPVVIAVLMAAAKGLLPTGSAQE